MQTRLFFVVFLAASLLGTAYAQKFDLDTQGRGIALTSEVQKLMDAADEAIAAAAPARAAAIEKVAEAEKNLRSLIKSSTSLVRLTDGKLAYLAAIIDSISAHRLAGPAFHKATMAYFDNVIAIKKAKLELSDDGYAKWQAAVLAATRYIPGEDHKKLLDETGAAITAARAREAERFRQMQEDFRKMQEADREMRKNNKI